MDYGSELTEADMQFLRQVYARDQDRLAALTGIRYGETNGSGRTETG
jgi:hypothetical protein